MEIKSKLEYPYSEKQKENFIVEQNHTLGYEIREVEREIEETIVNPETGEETTVTRIVVDLEAWGKTETEKFNIAKEAKFDENATKAKNAISDGYVTYKEAKFETDTTTCSDLTSTSLIMQTSGIETWEWVTKDDKVLTLVLEDFANIGGLIAQYKNVVWNVKYVAYKQQIQTAETIEELEAIIIDYDVPTMLNIEEDEIEGEETNDMQT